MTLRCLRCGSWATAAALAFAWSATTMAEAAGPAARSAAARAPTLKVSLRIPGAARSSAVEPGRPFDHAGRWIVDARGRVVTVHGFNMVDKLPPYLPSSLGFGGDDLRFLASHGFNTLRLGIIWKALEPSPGVYDDAYLDRLGKTIAAAGRRGMHVLLDFHQDMYNERFNGEGAPGWAAVDDGLPAAPDVGFPGNYAAMPALNRAFDHFWANDPGAGDTVGLQDRYAAAWRHVARRLRDQPAIFAYDVFNEPWPGSGWPECANTQGCPQQDRDVLTPFSRRVLAAIRAVDRRRLVFYEPHLTFDLGVDTSHADLADPHVGFGFHAYCSAASPGVPPVPGPGQEIPCQLNEQLVFDNAEQQATENGDALLLSEWGATDDPQVLQRVPGIADRNLMGWQTWSYWNRDVCCERPGEGLIRDPSRPPVADNVKAAKLDALERPYPRVIAGTPKRWSYDPAAKRFVLVYATRGPGGEDFSRGRSRTEVFVPRADFGAHPKLAVKGAKLIRGRGQTVILRSRRGAERVRLVVVSAEGDGR